jgi:hypothetical protein
MPQPIEWPKATARLRVPTLPLARTEALEGGELMFWWQLRGLVFVKPGVVAVKLFELGGVAVHHRAGLDVYLRKAYLMQGILAQSIVDWGGTLCQFSSGAHWLLARSGVFPVNSADRMVESLKS